MGAKNSIDLDTDPRSIIGSRLLDAPRELVFPAFTDPRYPRHTASISDRAVCGVS
jgi:hypothetical protein